MCWQPSTLMAIASVTLLYLFMLLKVNDKITLASELLWHFAMREATAAVGYDATLRQCRLRGKIDTNGVVSAYLEERFTPGEHHPAGQMLDAGDVSLKPFLSLAFACIATQVSTLSCLLSWTTHTPTTSLAGVSR
jgi:hypothetical protein